MGNIFDTIREAVGGDGKKEENDERLADAAQEQLEIENQQIIDRFNTLMLAHQEYLEETYPTKMTALGPVPYMQFPPVTWEDLYTKGNEFYSSVAYRYYRNMQDALNINNTSYENYVKALEDREVGEGVSGLGGDFEDDIVNEEKGEIDTLTQEEIDRLASEQVRFTEFRRFHKVLSKKSNDGLYDFVLSWEGEGVTQNDGSTTWAVIVKIMRHGSSDPIGKRLLLMTATLELDTWDGFKFSDYRTSYVSELDKFVFEYNQTSSGVTSDENIDISFPVLAFSLNNIWNTIKMIPSLIISVFNGLLFALPFLMLIWGTFFSIKFGVGKIEKIGGEIVA